MGLAMEVVSGRVTNPSTTITAVTVATGDTLAVRNFNQGSAAYLCQVWAEGATAGLVRVRSPRMHDNVQGIRLRYAASLPVPLLTSYARELLYAQDTLTVEMTGDASDTDGVSLLNYYTDLPGASARLATWAEIAPRIVHQSGTEVAITTGGTKGDYGGGVAINNTFDQFKANTDYALLGYLTDVSCQTVGVRGPDTGNLRVGGPGTNNKIETRDWFVKLSDDLGQPCIPIINAANKGATLVDIIDNTTSTAINVSLILAQLRS